MGGLHKQAFHAALNLMTKVGHPETEPVRVVGPYFSGSQTSLQFVVGDWWKQGDTLYAISSDHPPYRFQVITGNATAVRKSEFFSYESNKENFPAWRDGGIQFTSTVIPTRRPSGHAPLPDPRRGRHPDELGGPDLVPGRSPSWPRATRASGRQSTTYRQTRS